MVGYSYNYGVNSGMSAENWNFSSDGLTYNNLGSGLEAAKDGKFLSRDDFRQRTKATKTVIDLMGDLGLLGDMPESNQLSLFDFA